MLELQRFAIYLIDIYLIDIIVNKKMMKGGHSEPRDYEN